MRTFNIAGNCLADMHYMLPALPRIPDALNLVHAGRYFVLHAPRQSGKTTSIQALQDALNSEGLYHAVYCTLEAAAVESHRRNVIDSKWEDKLTWQDIQSDGKTIHLVGA